MMSARSSTPSTFRTIESNSVELARALERVMAERGEKPRRFKFFRAQMQTIISRACNEVDVEPLASRRCQTMTKWLDERVESVYKKHPGYDANAPPLMAFEPTAPKRLPDALRGESWAFVALPLVGVREEMSRSSAARCLERCSTSMQTCPTTR